MALAAELMGASSRPRHLHIVVIQTDVEIELSGQPLPRLEALRMDVNARTNDWADERRRLQLPLPHGTDPDCPGCEAFRLRRHAEEQEAP